MATTVSGAQTKTPHYRIGHLAIAAPTDNPPPPPANWAGFVQGLGEAGYLEGQNISFEHRSAHDQPDLFPALAAELADLKVDVIFARGTWALRGARNATRTIPIVGIDLEADPVEAGLVASIARPGGNIRGLFLDLSELSGKHLQIFKEIIPGASRIAVLGDPGINTPQIRKLQRVARSLSVQTQAVQAVSGTGGSSRTLSKAQKSGEPTRSLCCRIRFASPTEHKLRTLRRRSACQQCFFMKRMCARGRNYLLWAGPSGYVSPLRCLRGSILGGTESAHLPIERPTRFEMVVNRKTAKALGISIPETILVRATR